MESGFSTKGNRIDFANTVGTYNIITYKSDAFLRNSMPI